MAEAAPGISASAMATMKQGGGQGSAQERLFKAKSIRSKNTGVSSVLHDSYSASEDVDTSEVPQAGFDDFYSQVDSDDEKEEFDIVNPLYGHSGGEKTSRFRSGTLAPMEFGLGRLKSMFQWRYRTPMGRIQFVPIKGENLSTPTRNGAALEIRVRISLNGQSAVLDTNCPRGASPVFNPSLHTLQVMYFPVEQTGEELLKLEDMCELQVELNDNSDDSYIGSATIPQVKKFKASPTKLMLELSSELGCAAGNLEVEVSYHPYTLQDRMGLRGKFAFVEYPRSVLIGIRGRLQTLPGAFKTFLQAGLPSFKEGAGSWSVLALCCVPFILVSFLTNYSWAFRQWVLFVPLYVYMSLGWPVFFGWLFGTLITMGPLHGYPGRLKIGALHISLWIRDFRLHGRIMAEDSSFGNPPGFPLENFGECQRVDFKASVPLKHLWDVLTRNYKRCPLKKVPDFRLLAKFDFDFIEFENVMVDMQMYNSKFNIHEFSRMLAEGQAKNLGWIKGFVKYGEPIPNELEIRIIRAKNLVKTSTSTRQKAKEFLEESSRNITGQFGRNAVVEAFSEQFDENGSDREDEGGASMDYGGGGPPQFNPMDHTVQDKKNQGHFDPYVKITLRRDVQLTHTQTKTNNPMWNETFYFSQDDCATVVLVQVFNREFTGDVLLGQWMVTLKWLFADPYYCWHEKGMQVTRDRWMRGWFPLMNKHFRGVGKCGKLEMAMQWRYVEKLKRPVSFPPLTALAQLQENSAETRLRMGDMARVKYWLNHEPFLYDIKRVTVRGIRFFVQDLFRGYKGRAEQAGVERSNSVEIARLDYLTEFRPRHKGDLGITTFKVVYHFFRGVAPKILDSATSQAHVAGAIGQIASSATYQMGHNLNQLGHKLMRGEMDRVGVVQSASSTVKSVSKAADKAIQLLHRTVTQNKDNDAQFKTLVSAEDEDFLLDRISLKGYVARYAVKATPSQPGGIPSDIDMEKEVARKGQFKRKYFELKGKTIFYRKNKDVSKSSLYATSYKIELSKCIGAIYYIQQDELMLNMHEEGYFNRLKLYANDAEGGEDEAEEGGVGNPTLQDWLDALKACGVPCYSWNRGKPV